MSVGCPSIFPTMDVPSGRFIVPVPLQVGHRSTRSDRDLEFTTPDLSPGTRMPRSLSPRHPAPQPQVHIQTDRERDRPVPPHSLHLLVSSSDSHAAASCDTDLIAAALLVS
eukprot:3248222-Rhodomonas_salina.1